MLRAAVLTFAGLLVTVGVWLLLAGVPAPGVYALGDFNFKNPGAPIVVNANVSRKHEAANFEMFDYPGEFDDRGSGEAYAKVRIQELQAQHEVERTSDRARRRCRRQVHAQGSSPQGPES